MTIDGEVIPTGSIVRLLLASANRDPHVYVEPETFDPDLRRQAHIAFGRGMHSCLGMWLAREEACCALSALAQTISSVVTDPDDPPELNSGGSFNEFGFHRLPVILK